MLQFILFTILITNAYCSGNITTNQALIDSRSTNLNDGSENPFSIIPSHSYQYHTNVNEYEYSDSADTDLYSESSKSNNQLVENKGYSYSSTVKSNSPGISSDNVASASYQSPQSLPNPNQDNYQPSQKFQPIYSDPAPSTNNNFYYYYNTQAPPASPESRYDSPDTSTATVPAYSESNAEIKYSAPHKHKYSTNSYEQPPVESPESVYSHHDHYHSHEAPPSGRDGGPPPPPFTGPGGPPFTGPGGPPGPPLPPPPPPIKGSIDYILIPLILIGIAGPIFVVLYVILGAFEAKLAPITARSLSNSAAWNLNMKDVDKIMSFVSKALEKYGY